MLKRIGFKGQNPSEYAGTEPPLNIRQHLSGEMISEGIIFGPMGRIVSRFVADMDGSWDGGQGILKEDFAFASGGIQHREWHLTLGKDGQFSGTADDIIGKMHGLSVGATTRMTYRLKLAPDAGGHVLNVVDWMYLMENGAILNRSQMRKFGIKVAELVATIRRKHG